MSPTSIVLHPVPKPIRRQILATIRANGSTPIGTIVIRILRLIKYLTNLSIKTGIKIFRLIFVQRSTVSTFLFAYIYEVLPKLVSRFFSHLFKLDFKGYGSDVIQALSEPLDPGRLPVFMTKLVATLNAFLPIYTSILRPHIQPDQLLFFSSFCAAFTSAVLNFPSFQTEKLKQDRHYTLDWTLVLITRALDTVITSNFASMVDAKTSTLKHLDRFGDVIMFMASCYVIMETWFYEPEKLPPDYKRWIDKATAVDDEIVQGMKYLKSNQLNYDVQDQGGPQHDHFEKYCTKYGKIPSLGDPLKFDKLPCEIFHQFKTRSCLKHAVLRFWLQFKFAFKAYFAINAFVFIFVKKFRANPIRMLIKTVRSASFLGAYSAIQWGVFCYVRNNHPHWFGQRFWDVWALKAGSALSGISIMLEYPDRRDELSMYVAPKALGTFVDPEPTDKNIKMEILAFSLSFAVLIAYAKLNPAKLRGLLGKGLSFMVKD
ncbi:hypothetical protein Cantr_03010 [Candida viswanathii]|uniref:Transmembrane protein 135 N-terminal domain-containing protein n=1 Tax=Candida viswanathii TaxID=5486 RepID=A0A367YMI6_9ASCO|nr:hypothetical protein Cantr_03010 [Candida viswanathii]